MVASDLPWTPNHVRLPVEPALFALSKTANGKEFGQSLKMKNYYFMLIDSYQNTPRV